jgi:5'(3')-deoxyribonucleotidase
MNHTRAFINLDCDGVLANFVKAACKAHNRPNDISRWDFIKDWDMTPGQFWSKCRGKDFWLKLEEFEYAQDLVAELRELCVDYSAELTITTAPSADPECVNAKLEWLYHHFGFYSHDVILGPKKWVMAHPRSILIDDKPENVKKFNEYSGYGLLFPQPWNNDEQQLDIFEDWHELVDEVEQILITMRRL